MTCFWDRTADYSYTLCIVFVSIGPPVTVILVCYVSIFLQVLRSRKAVQNHGSTGGAEAVTPQEIKLVKALFTIFIVFIICWIPFWTCAVFDSKDQWPKTVYIIVAQMAHMNSSLNSVIYAASNKDFRDGYKQVFYTLICCCKKPKKVSY